MKMLCSKLLTFIQVIALLLSLPVYGRSLDIPPSISSKAVYHVQATQIDELSCTFNCLFNACNMSNLCGVRSEYSSYELFKRTALEFCRTQNIKPQGAVWSTQSSHLARVLRMKNVCNLAFLDGKVVPLFETPTRISFPEGTSTAEQKRLMSRTLETRRQGCIKAIKDALQKGMGKTLVMHFICTVELPSGEHAILITLVQNTSGRGLYIFDNLNDRLTEYSFLKRFIQFLCVQYEVSARAQFKGPSVPERWPAGPRNRAYIL